MRSDGIDILNNCLAQSMLNYQIHFTVRHTLRLRNRRHCRSSITRLAAVLGVDVDINSVRRIFEQTY